MTKNVEDQVVNDIKSLWNVTSLQQHDRYLGLQYFVGKSRNITFKVFKERKLQGWKEKMLSQVGREILIKAVVQAFTNTHYELL